MFFLKEKSSIKLQFMLVFAGGWSMLNADYCFATNFYWLLLRLLMAVMVFVGWRRSLSVDDFSVWVFSFYARFCCCVALIDKMPSENAS